MVELMERRAIISLIGWQGLRCGETGGLIWADARTELGRRTHLRVHRALKDVAGHLQLGLPKNKVKRTPLLWQPLVDELDALWHAQGCPPLDQHIFRNRDGGLFRWDGFRDRSFYKALHSAGVIAQRDPNAIGAFAPKDFRHTAATLHFHARWPDGRLFAAPDVAKRMGHTIGVLHAIYVGVMDDDLQGAAGESFDELIRRTRRAVWGPLPGDVDYENPELTAIEASELCGLTVSVLSARLLRGAIPARKENGKYLIHRHNLVMAGLVKPRADHFGTEHQQQRLKRRRHMATRSKTPKKDLHACVNCGSTDFLETQDNVVIEWRCSITKNGSVVDYSKNPEIVNDPYTDGYACAQCGKTVNPYGLDVRGWRRGGRRVGASLRRARTRGREAADSAI